MAMIKCKMCGGDLNVTEGMTVAECEYCGCLLYTSARSP